MQTTKTPCASRWHSVNDRHTLKAMHDFCSKYRACSSFCLLCGRGSTLLTEDVSRPFAPYTSIAQLLSVLTYADWLMHILPICNPLLGTDGRLHVLLTSRPLPYIFICSTGLMQDHSALKTYRRLGLRKKLYNYC